AGRGGGRVHRVRARCRRPAGGAAWPERLAVAAQAARAAPGGARPAWRARRADRSGQPDAARVGFGAARSHVAVRERGPSMAQKKGELLVGLDIGTTKICCIVGEVTPEGIDVIGIGTHPSRGLRKGVVINIEATVSSTRRAIEEAELMAGCEIESVYAGIAGGHIRGFNSQGVVAVKDKE